MTPLITQMAWALKEDPTVSMWFDISEATKALSMGKETLSAERLLLAMENPLPFPNCAIVGIEANGNKFAIGLTAVNDGTDPRFKFDGVMCGGIILNQANKWRNLDTFIYYPTTANKAAETLSMHFVDTTLEEDQQALQDRAVSLLVITCWVEHINADNRTGYISTKQANHLKRMRQGKLPLFDWKTVTIDLPKQKFPHQGGTHASPRLHDVRGHWVTRNGKRFWKKPHKRGDASKGVVFHDYKIKPAVMETNNESL